MKRLILGLVVMVVVVAVATNAAHASLYSFSNVIDSGMDPLLSKGEPSLNDNGVVAFGGIVSGYGSGIFTIDGATITPIAIGGGFGAVAWINNSGFVSFRQGGTVESILRSNGTITTTIADTQGTFTGLGSRQINDNGTVACRADLAGGGQMIFAGDGNSNVTIANTADPASPFGGPSINPLAVASINGSGSVAFRANLKMGGQGIYLSDGTTITTIADSSGQFTGFDSRFTVNDNGVAGFRASLDSGGSGIFTSDGTTTTLIADTNTPGSFIGLNDPVMINNAGTVAFEARTDIRVINGANVPFQGIYTGPDPIDDKVIARGDSLFGSTVTGVTFSRGLNNNGQIAFEYFLENGITGIAVASPVSSVIPEPTTFIVWSLLGFCGMCITRHRRRK